MLKHLTLAASLLAFGTALLSLENEGQEPALGVKLTLGAIEQDLALGEAFELKLGGKTYQGKLEAAATRTFNKRGLSFEYPAGFAYEYDPSEEVTIFTVEAADTVIMLQVFPLEMNAEELCQVVMEATAEAYGGLSVATTEVEITLDGETLSGMELKATLLDTQYVQRGFGLALDGATAVLFLQGSLDAKGQLDEGASDAIELLTSTFSFN